MPATPLTRYLQDRAYLGCLDKTDIQYRLTLHKAHDKLSCILEHDPNNKKATQLRLAIEDLTEFLADHE